MQHRILFLLLVFLALSWSTAAMAAEPMRWRSVDYADNFMKTFIPTPEAIGRMGVKGFFTLWGILSFLETHLPEGLDGRKYVVATRDLRTSIRFFKNDMLYLVYEMLGVRSIDREVLKVQIFDITGQLQVVIRTIQSVRRSLLKAAYYLFGASVNKNALQPGKFQFGASLNYLSTDNPWRGWLPRKNLYRQVDVAESLELDVAKLNIFLDYWVFNRPRVREDFAETVHLLRTRGFKIYLASEGINAHFRLDLTFGDRNGDPVGLVNWLTWKHQAAQGLYALAENFKPDYLTILRNPFIELQEQVNQRVSPTDWLEFVRDVAAGVQRISPDTAVVIEVPLNTDREVDFLRAVDQLEGENIRLGFMVYSIKDLFSIGQFIASQTPVKRMLIAELWDSVGLYIDDLAEEFLRLAYLWSLDKGFELLNISFCVNLHTPEFARTPAWHVLHNLITRGSVVGEDKSGVKAGLDHFHGRLDWRGDGIPVRFDRPVRANR